MKSQIKSKQRVSDHGEVFTRKEEVNAMLDLVKDETLRIESRFLEPACGDGNFLIEILRRKLAVVEKQYAKSQREYEFYLVLAIGAVYGIELQYDNVSACRKRLCGFAESSYRLLFPETANDEVIEVVRFILSLNIVQGNALKMCYVDENNRDLENRMLHFSQWSPVSFGRKWSLKRHDFEYRHLVFDGAEPYRSVQEYFACYFLEIRNAKPIRKPQS